MEQIEALDRKEEKNKKIEELAQKIHAEKFPEEYDFMYDSISDANDRKNGKNPMNKESIDRVNNKRAILGVSPLSESGMSTSTDTMALCIEEAKKSASSDI